MLILDLRSYFRAQKTSHNRKFASEAIFILQQRYLKYNFTILICCHLVIFPDLSYIFKIMFTVPLKAWEKNAVFDLSLSFFRPPSFFFSLFSFLLYSSFITLDMVLHSNNDELCDSGPVRFSSDFYSSLSFSLMKQEHSSLTSEKSSEN